MKTLGKILGYIALALGILLIFAYLVYYIDGSLPQHFLPEQVIDIFRDYIRPFAALIIVGIIVLTTMMKHSIVLTIIFAVLIGAVAVLMIVSLTKDAESTETVINLVKALVC